MAVKFELDKKKDQLVPCKAFKNWGNSVEQKTLKDAGTLEKLFTSEEKREEKKKKLQAIAAATKTLPDAGRAWFVDIFLSAFGGKADDLAKDLFKDLTKGAAFKELEKATSEYNAKFKAKALAVATASAALTKRVAYAMTPVAGAFGKEFKERILIQPAPQQAPLGSPAAPPPAPTGTPQPARPTAESIDRELYQSKKLLELGFITENEHLAKLVEVKNALLNEAEALNAKKQKAVITQIQANPDITLKQLQDFMSKQGKQLTKNFDQVQLDDLKSRYPAQSATPTNDGKTSANPAAPGAPPPSGAASQPATTGAAPVAPAATPPAAPQANPIASAISTLVGQTENDPNGELVKLTQQSGATQQAFTDMEKGVVAESLTHKQQQLVKLQVKKQVLAEYVKTGEVATKTQLNEFFLTALIFAALAGVIAWATSKLWPVLKDAVNGAPASGRSRGGDPAKETQELVQSLGGGYNSQGQLVDINGKAVPDIKKQVKQFKDDLQQKGDVIKTAANIAITKADDGVKVLPSFQPFQQTFTASPQTEIAAVITALDNVATEE